ncbi:hypothetical protein [Halobacillus litoralis]|nr:hypothetical protein [Halobacillus litoralis]
MPCAGSQIQKNGMGCADEGWLLEYEKDFPPSRVNWVKGSLFHF